MIMFHYIYKSMKVFRFKSNCIHQWSFHFKNGWIIQTTYQIQELKHCNCFQSCHHIRLLHSYPGILIGILPYRYCNIGILHCDNPSLIDMKLVPISKWQLPAFTIGISGPTFNTHFPYYKKVVII